MSRIAMIAATAALAFAVPVGATAADSVAGTARVMTANMLLVDGALVRFYAVEALEHDQTCANPLVDSYPCGQVAAGLLANALRGQRVVCMGVENVPRDDHGALVAVCRLGDLDVGQRMIRSGFALADPDHPEVYGQAEREAREAGIGIWQGPFVMPWDWRAGVRNGGVGAPAEK